METDSNSPSSRRLGVNFLKTRQSQDLSSETPTTDGVEEEVNARVEELENLGHLPECHHGGISYLEDVLVEDVKCEMSDGDWREEDEEGECDSEEHEGGSHFVIRLVTLILLQRTLRLGHTNTIDDETVQNEHDKSGNKTQKAET